MEKNKRQSLRGFKPTTTNAVWRWGQHRKGLENTSASETGTHGTAAVCLLKCWERTSENHILHAGNEPLFDIWAAAPQRQVASRGPPSSMEYLNRPFPSTPPPHSKTTPRARAHTLTHTHTLPQPEQRGVPDVPRVHRAVWPGSQKAGVCTGGVETDRRTHAHALPPLPRRGRAEDVRGQTRRPDRRRAGAGGHRGGHLGAPRPRGVLRCFRSARATRVACRRQGQRRRGAAAAPGSGREGAGRALGAR